MAPGERTHPEAATGLILAGGASSRMGLPKPLVDLDGLPMIVRVAQRLSTVCPEIVVCANDPGMAAGLPVRVVPDARPGMGPLAGLGAGLSAASHPLAVVTGCDMPFLEPALLRHLVAAAEMHDAVVVRDAGGVVQPLCAVYRRSCLPAIARALASGERRAAGFHPWVRVRYFDEDEWRAFDPAGSSWRSLDTPEDVASAGFTRPGSRAGPGGDDCRG